MASCAAGVHVITTDGEAGRYGITMTAVTAVTDEPPTVMLCINRQSAIIPILQGNRDLCINTLNDSQQDVAEHFAGLTDLSPEERFEYHIWHRGKPDSSKSKARWRTCTAALSINAKSARITSFFVQINEIRNTDAQAPALLYFRRQFKSLA